VAHDAAELLLLSVASREGVFLLHIRVLGVIVQGQLHVGRISFVVYAGVLLMQLGNCLTCSLFVDKCNAGPPQSAPIQPTRQCHCT